jgi:phage shock protein C
MKRLYRSVDDRIIAGVCGGIGEYFGIDPVLVRLLWALFVLVYGAGIILYLIAWVIIPSAAKAKKKAEKEARPIEAGVALGAVLVVAAIAILLRNLFGWFKWIYATALVLLAMGLYLIFRRG